MTTPGELAISCLVQLNGIRTESGWEQDRQRYPQIWLPSGASQTELLGYDLGFYDYAVESLNITWLSFSHGNSVVTFGAVKQ